MDFKRFISDLDYALFGLITLDLQLCILRYNLDKAIQDSR